MNAYEFPTFRSRQLGRGRPTKYFLRIGIAIAWGRGGAAKISRGHRKFKGRQMD